MIDHRRYRLFLFAICLCVPAQAADLRLADIFGDHMVLQRHTPIRIWGQGTPTTALTVTLGQHVSKQTTVGEDGHWQLELPPVQAGGPHQLVVESVDDRIWLDDVLVGEVWIASGQSNMQWPLQQTHDARNAIDHAQCPQLRLFTVPMATAFQPIVNIDTTWSVCSPATIAGFSAVAYHFGLRLQDELGVPVGLINTSWGATRIEPWTAAPHVDWLIERLSGQAARTVSSAVARREEAASMMATRPDQQSEPSGGPDAAIRTTDRGTGTPVLPSVIYNAMIHPLVPFSVGGMIWYQGESNVSEGAIYTDKMLALIDSWRDAFEQGDLPFYFVELAPYRYGNPTYLPAFWRAQSLVSHRRANVGSIPIYDVGDLDDIHPRDKRTVGHRLANLALRRTYRRGQIVDQGPQISAVLPEPGHLRLLFDHARGLATRDGESPIGFEVIDSQGRSTTSAATIEGESVIVEYADVRQVRWVQFAWDQEAASNLVNGAGLPARPFRTYVDSPADAPHWQSWRQDSGRRP